MAETPLARELGDLVGRIAQLLLEHTESGTTSHTGEAEAKARTLRQDPSRVAGSLNFASVLAYGHFVLEDGPTIRCEAIPGISGVVTMPTLTATEDGRPEAMLRRILTHFHFDEPSVAIEQHYGRESTGTLTGAQSGPKAPILPGRASFSQYLILNLDGRPLANPEPLVMTADRVDEWPPISSAFVSEAPTRFVELDRLDDPDAPTVAHLMACKAVAVSDLSPLLPTDVQRSAIE